MWDARRVVYEFEDTGRCTVEDVETVAAYCRAQSAFVSLAAETAASAPESIEALRTLASARAVLTSSLGVLKEMRETL